MNGNNMSLFNDGSHTYLHPATGTYTSIDLTLSDSSLLQDFDWSVHGDLCGSDHLPIVLEPSLSLPEEHIPRWKFSEADWLTFSSLCLERLTFDKIDEELDPIQTFSDILTDIAKATIPQTTANPKIHKPWFNDNCKAAIRSRKKSERKFNKHPTPWNLDNCRKRQDAL